MNIIRINFDGACNNHKKSDRHMGVGVAVFIDNIYQEDLSKSIGLKGDSDSSSNVAEWFGCMEAMRLASEITKPNEKYIFKIYSDSQIIASQFNGDYRINKEHFKDYYQVSHMYAEITGITEVIWIPREKNKEADRLSKIALKSVDNAYCSTGV